jgi:hypothetical protein
MAHAPKTPDLISGKAVKGLVESRELRGALVLGQPGGFAVVVRYGSHERAIAAQRSRQIRLWRNLNTAAAYVRDELGMQRFEIDMADHDADAVERRRPDTAERQRQLREAAEHDAWFRQQVQEALDGIEDGTNPPISEEEWENWLSEKIASLERRAAKSGR